MLPGSQGIRIYKNIMDTGFADQQEAEGRLFSELEAARVEWQQAGERFRAILAEVPSGLPNPDGTYRISSASRAYRTAGEKYRSALTRFAACLFDR